MNKYTSIESTQIRMHEKDCVPPRPRLPLKGKLAAFADG